MGLPSPDKVEARERMPRRAVGVVAHRSCERDLGSKALFWRGAKKD